MGKVKRRKPGPKSVTRSKITTNRGTLGEASSGSQSEDDSGPENISNQSSPQKTVTPGRVNARNAQSEIVDASEFRTPEVENDITDYGLEFTTSDIRHASPRRCSTLKNMENSQEQQKGNAPLAGAMKSSPRTKKVSQHKSTKSEMKPPRETNVGDNETPLQATKQFGRKRRKQLNPLQLEKRFWNEVAKLQTRVNLIPMLPFSRLVRELMQDASTDVTKITPTALEALQISSEMYLTQTMQDAYMLTLHRGRVTLDVKDMELINFLKTNL